MATSLSDLRADAGLDVLGEAARVCGAIHSLPSIETLMEDRSQESCTVILDGTGVRPDACAPPEGPTTTAPELELPPSPPAPY